MQNNKQNLIIVYFSIMHRTVSQFRLPSPDIISFCLVTKSINVSGGIQCSITPKSPTAMKKQIKQSTTFSLFVQDISMNAESILHNTLQRQSHELSNLLTNTGATLPLLHFIHIIKNMFSIIVNNIDLLLHMHQYYSSLTPSKQHLLHLTIYILL